MEDLLSRTGWPRPDTPRLIGESPAHFYAAKLILALFLGLRFRGLLSSPVFSLVGFMLPDGLLYLADRKRKSGVLCRRCWTSCAGRWRADRECGRRWPHSRTIGKGGDAFGRPLGTHPRLAPFSGYFRPKNRHGGGG